MSDACWYLTTSMVTMSLRGEGGGEGQSREKETESDLATDEMGIKLL